MTDFSFTPDQKQAHLNNVLKYHPDIKFDKIVHLVIAVDARVHGRKTFQNYVKEILGEDGILSIEYQTGLTYSQKTGSGYMLGYDLSKYKHTVIYKKPYKRRA